MNELDHANWCFKQNVSFEAGAQNLDQIPSLGSLKEFAFVGRSNVGKSSLINALTYRNSLARVSSNPGCTKQINFFKLSDILVLVDLPGYGYAKISATERQHWSQVITKYLVGRVELTRIFLLIDARHGVKPNDLEIMKILDSCGISYMLVFTKADKTSKNILKAHEENAQNLFKLHPAMYPKQLYTSSEAKQGIEELRYEIIKANS
ncbi:ribosome biogenesis GTP-binding protein YihA/YsxC [Rickettsiales endosymbiont of Stachyamoeba lipophora]|uniref:ribosome biogenesis GTP-binding protein YihA/YsxC n=1 Tax=Rickettsiales endosymbiont of Stachyamoeba lipophora TaxID=2486578 RepID=UPI000F6558F2|nr:ribosome biogenesis GTP-binding protein YihA/YsxC [Rickettsiales endosymbiont of Stachyamoeba lipophora]AZL15731.1 YihA family ribosome biogenesis GTP-binding protein [Rickettsiales endosymbiont of Stachyamoeba lipophora]